MIQSLIKLSTFYRTFSDQWFVPDEVIVCQFIGQTSYQIDNLEQLADDLKRMFSAAVTVIEKLIG
jgi:hypothetical protein